MKKMILVLMAAAIVLAGLMTGCSKNDDDQSTAVVILAVDIKNSEKPKSDSDIIEETAYKAIRSNGRVAIVSVDGDPDVIMNKDYELDDSLKNANSSKLDAIAAAETEEFQEILDNAKADSEEVDILKAITIAARILKEAPDSAEKIIIIAHSGISTTGIINFNNNLLNAQPEDIVSALEEKEAVPQLSGTKVYWQQLGNTAAPQAELSEKQRKSLTNIWSAIITAGGGEFNNISAMAVDSEETASLPNVTCVNVDIETPVTFDSSSQISAASFENPLTISEETIGFYPDSAQYIDDEATKSLLDPIATYMKTADNTFSLAIVGSCAGDVETNWTKELSQQRADAVKNSLISLGVDGSRISAKGMGVSDPWHIKGAGESGELAAKNRKVVLLNAASETAKNLTF